MTDPRFVTNVELVPAAFVHDEMEGEMIRGLLEDAGIPSVLQLVGLFEGARRGLAGGYGGSQKVMVHAHRLAEAQALIAATLAENEADGGESTAR